MKYQNLFSEKNKKDVINLSSATIAHRVLKVYIYLINASEIEAGKSKAFLIHK